MRASSWIRREAIQRWPKRVPELLAIEGWYAPAGLPRFKVSCRFNDILRASSFAGKRHHFHSCMQPGHQAAGERVARCWNPHWAVVYTPSRNGDFLGRAWITWEPARRFVVYKVYGNKLDAGEVCSLIEKRGYYCRHDSTDVYLLD